MRTVSKRDLNQRTAAVLDEVSRLGEVVVTERGQPRWRVSAMDVPDEPLARLEREGRYTPPAPVASAWPHRPGGPTYTDAEIDTLLDEIKGDH